MADPWTLVIEDMEARRKLGIERYGKPVEPSDPVEDWEQHLAEELMDALVYLKAKRLRRLRMAHDPSLGRHG